MHASNSPAGSRRLSQQTHPGDEPQFDAIARAIMTDSTPNFDGRQWSGAHVHGNNSFTPNQGPAPATSHSFSTLYQSTAHPQFHSQQSYSHPSNSNKCSNVVSSTQEQNTQPFRPVFSVTKEARGYALCVKSALYVAVAFSLLELGTATFLLTRGSRVTTFIALATIVLALFSAALSLIGNLGLSRYIAAGRSPSLKLQDSLTDSSASQHSTTSSEADPHAITSRRLSVSDNPNPQLRALERRNAERSIQSSSLLTFFLTTGSHLLLIKAVFAIAVLVLSESHAGYLVQDWLGDDPTYHHMPRAFTGSVPAHHSRHSSMSAENRASWLSFSFARSDLNYIAARAAADSLQAASGESGNSREALDAIESTASAATLLSGSVSLASCVALTVCVVLIRMKVPFPLDTLQLFLTNALFLGFGGLCLLGTTIRLRTVPAELEALGHSLQSDISFAFFLCILVLIAVVLGLRRASSWYYIESQRSDIDDWKSHAMLRIPLQSAIGVDPASLSAAHNSKSHSPAHGDNSPSHNQSAGQEDALAAAARGYTAILKEYDEFNEEMLKSSSSGRSTRQDFYGLLAWIQQLDANRVQSAITSARDNVVAAWDWVEALARGRAAHHSLSDAGSASRSARTPSLIAVLHKVTTSALFFFTFLCLIFILARIVDLVDVLPYAVPSQGHYTDSTNVQYVGDGAVTPDNGGASTISDEWNGGTMENDYEWDAFRDSSTANDASHRPSMLQLNRNFVPSRNVRGFSLLSVAEASLRSDAKDDSGSSHGSSEADEDDSEAYGESFESGESDHYRVFLLQYFSSLIILCGFSAFAMYAAYKAEEWATIPTLNRRSVNWYRHQLATRKQQELLQSR